MNIDGLLNQKVLIQSTRIDRPETLQGTVGEDELGGGLFEQRGVVFEDFNGKSSMANETRNRCQIRSPGKTAGHRPCPLVAGAAINIGEGHVPTWSQNPEKLVRHPFPVGEIPHAFAEH